MDRKKHVLPKKMYIILFLESAVCDVSKAYEPRNSLLSNDRYLNALYTIGLKLILNILLC